jgi:ketosteroid isomerase-like protein
VTLTAAESLEILELVALVDDCATARDASAYAELFTEDGTLTGVTGTATGRAALRDAVGAAWAAEPPETMHVTLNATIDESGPEPEVRSVMLIVTRGPAPRVLGSALVSQLVQRTADGWRVASRVIHDESSSDPAAARSGPPLADGPQTPMQGMSLSAGSSARRRPEGGGAVRVRLQAPSAGAVVWAVLILTVCALVLHLVWRVRGVVRLGAIIMFLALALLPIIDAVATRTRARARSSSSWSTWY